MSTELVFKRPGRIELAVRKSDGGFIYASLMQKTAKGWKHLVSIQGASPTQCYLIDLGTVIQSDEWVLEVAGARFFLKTKEADQVRDQLGIQIFQMEKQP